MCCGITPISCIVGFPQTKHQKVKYAIFYLILKIHQYRIIKPYTITIIFGKFNTSLYHLSRKNRFMYFGITLIGYIVGFPQTKRQKVKYAIFYQILKIHEYSIIKPDKITIIFGKSNT